MNDSSFRAYLKAIVYGVTHIKLSKYDKQFLKFLGFLLLLMASMISPFFLLQGCGDLGALLGIAIWLLSWLCLFYIPWRTKNRNC